MSRKFCKNCRYLVKCTDNNGKVEELCNAPENTNSFKELNWKEAVIVTAFDRTPEDINSGNKCHMYKAKFWRGLLDLMSR